MQVFVANNLGAGGAYMDRLRFVGAIELFSLRASAVLPLLRLKGPNSVSIPRETVAVEASALHHVLDRFQKDSVAFQCGDVHSVRIHSDYVRDKSVPVGQH